MRLNGKGLGWVILRQTAGYTCLAVGVIGCVLPILPGIPLLFAGLGLLSADSPWAARLLRKLKEKTGGQWARFRKKPAAAAEAKIPE